MSYEANLYASLVDQIKAGAPGFSIAVAPERVYMALVPASNQEYPVICIRFPQQPYDSGKWSATGNKRDGLFVAELGIICQIPDGLNHPYGDASTPGILNLVTDIKNLLENAWATFKAAEPELVDYQFTTSMFQNEGAQPPLVSCTLTIAFITRFTAGNRSN